MITSFFEHEQYEKQVEEACPSDMDSESPDRMFFELLAKSYNSFLLRTENEPDDMQLEKDLSLAYRESALSRCFQNGVTDTLMHLTVELKNQDTQEELARVRKANEKMQQEVVELTDSRLESLQEQRGLLVKDLEKFRLLIDNLHKHHQDVAAKLTEVKADAVNKGDFLSRI